LALEHGLVRPGTSVLDYGCGHGDDVRHLRDLGISATGWDPHYHPEKPLEQADVVNLGYVLNVVEDIQERAAVLARAFQLAQHLLIVAVRVDHGPQTGEAFNDGLITNRSGFQKIYTQAEFRSFVEGVCGRAPAMSGLGIGYLFKNPEWESLYLQHAVAYRPVVASASAIEEFRASEVGREFINVARSLARLPRPREFPRFELLQQRFGSPQRILRLAAAVLDPKQLEHLRQSRRESFLVYFAAMRLQGLTMPSFGLLPQATQADILSIWPSFKAARSEGENFLYSLGRSERVESAMRESKIGKFVGDALYAHRSVEDQLPAICRLQIFAARQIVGQQDYDVVKLAADGRRVSFLKYPNFDRVPHPSLSSSLIVYLPKAEYSYRDFSSSSNPPILHRKDSLVDGAYPQFRKFTSLTRQEERHGLLSRSDIGHKQLWEQILADRGFSLRGHRLVRRS
jgi:DNA phosphorothioation-associated putative methyltransferase